MLPEPTPKPLLIDRDEHTMIVTINRPEVRNAVNLAVHELLGAALEEAEADRDAWTVVLTGSGNRAFCAGADLRALSAGEPLVPDDEARRAWGFAGYVAHPISKPTIAAVNGVALGGGTELVLASDLVVLSDAATLGLTEVRRGIIAAGGGAFRLPQQIPEKIANELLYTGDALSADRALALGLANRVVAQNDVLSAALELAARINANAPLAVQGTKRIARTIRDGRSLDDESAWEVSGEEFENILLTADAVEGPLAFAEKRAPQWVAG